MTFHPEQKTDFETFTINIDDTWLLLPWYILINNGNNMQTIKLKLMMIMIKVERERERERERL